MFASTVGLASSTRRKPILLSLTSYRRKLISTLGCSPSQVYLCLRPNTSYFDVLARQVNQLDQQSSVSSSNACRQDTPIVGILRPSPVLPFPSMTINLPNQVAIDPTTTFSLQQYLDVVDTLSQPVEPQPDDEQGHTLDGPLFQHAEVTTTTVLSRADRPRVATRGGVAALLMSSGGRYTVFTLGHNSEWIEEPFSVQLGSLRGRVAAGGCTMVSEVDAQRLDRFVEHTSNVISEPRINTLWFSADEGEFDFFQDVCSCSPAGRRVVGDGRWRRLSSVMYGSKYREEPRKFARQMEYGQLEVLKS